MVEALNLIKNAAKDNRKVLYHNEEKKFVGDTKAWDKIAQQLSRNNNVSVKSSLHLRHVLWVGNTAKKIKGMIKERRTSC